MSERDNIIRGVTPREPDRAVRGQSHPKERPETAKSVEVTKPAPPPPSKEGK